MGFLRLFLAIDVLYWHLPIATGSKGPPILLPGSFMAVCCFFIVSGFYMAMVLNENQSYKGPSGLLTFYFNRALRIFFPYWLVLFVVIIAAQFNVFLSYEWSLKEAFANPWHALVNNMLLIPLSIKNMFLVHAENYSKYLLIGSMITVGLELIFYAIAPFIVKRSLPILVTVTGMACVLHFLPYQLGLPSNPWQYEVFPYIFCFFMLGALSYRLYAFLNQFKFDRRWGWIAIPVITSFIVAGHLNTNTFTNSIYPWTFYIVVAALLPSLFLASKSSVLDRTIGDLSYPIYVVHMPIIFLFNKNHAEYMVPLWTIVAAIWLMLIVERPIDVWRHNVRLSILPASLESILMRFSAIVSSMRKVFSLYMILVAVIAVTLILALWSKSYLKNNKNTAPQSVLSVHASSQFETYGPNGLLNSREPGWHAATPVVFPQSITIEAHDILNIQSLSFLPQDGFLKRMPKKMAIEVSEDGRAWQKVATVNDLCTSVDKDGWHNVQLPSRTHGKLLRLVIYSNCGDPEYLTLRGLNINKDF